MKYNLFKTVLASACGVIIGTMLMSTIFLLAIIAIQVIVGSANYQSEIKSNSILKLELDYPISDKPNTDPFANFTPFGNFEINESHHLYKILNGINIAAKNNNIEGIVLNLTNFQSPGSASTREIREALMDFKQTGKFIYAYSTYYSKTSYYLASVSDSIFMYPIGAMSLEGLSSTTPFFTETMKEIGIKPEIIRHGKFKAAVEPFMLNEMSAENREQTETLLNDVWLTMLQDISKSRNISINDLNKISNDLMLTLIPGKSIDMGLIDQLFYPDDFSNFLAKKINTQNTENINFTSLSNLNNKSKKSDNKIAIIYAEGQIDGTEYNINSDYVNTVKEVLEDDNINAVVLRVNSPGGSVLISDEILSQMKISKNKKPIIVSMGNVAASGGYYISCAADKIFASPNTITGSIGVFGLFFTAEELLTDKMKLSFSTVKTNKFADLGLPWKGLSNEEKDLLQISVKNTYNDFVNIVANARSMSKEEIDNIGQGRVWTGLRAHKIGLVDSLGGLQDALIAAGELARIEDYEIIEYPKEKTAFEIILEDLEQAQQFRGKTIEDIYIDKFKQKLSKMQGIQALLPVEYQID